ncbi:TPA: hypothetical protein DDZ86_03145 [Candidatus Dependentiae bacterium]|nr:MAG: Penicillin-binding protein 2 [candidate division TM6 bacterium GW2011_GWF2_43_87]HBL98612.1 hypothetical protein [Candidatus Dependentiae bacterium]
MKPTSSIPSATTSSTSISKRLRLLRLGICIICAVIILTLFRFQVFNGEFFRHHSRRNFLRHKTISSLRGAILDRHGVPLASNRPVTSLFWHGTRSPKLTDKQNALIDLISTLVNPPTAHIPNRETIALAERLGNDCALIPDLPFEKLCFIMEHYSQNPNISIQTASARYYPQGNTACHIVGYFRPSSQRQSLMGLEKLFEEQLRGTPGQQEMVVNSIGHNLLSREIKRAQDGEPLWTTLDLNLQRIGEELFDEGLVGALIAMDAQTGDLLAVVSKPSFDPNMFTGPVSDDLWKNCVENKPFINRAFSSCYPPASVFKLITATAMIEEKTFPPNTSWHCAGEINWHGRSWKCSSYEHGGHGFISSIEEALAKSCNIPFFEIGKRISIDTLARYAHKFGLGEPTGVIFPEKAGLIPTAAWKRKTRGEPWSQGETVLAAIGQTYCQATPLQMIRVVGSICTGFLVRPRILLAESIDRKPLEISQATRELLQRSMKRTIKQGTGVSLSRLSHMEIYGKTGTAQTSSLEKRGMGRQYLEHGWFVCCARYKDYPPIALAVFLENVGSSSFATRLTKDFLTRYCAHLDHQEAADEEAEIEDNETGAIEEKTPQSHPEISSAENSTNLVTQSPESLQQPS